MFGFVKKKDYDLLKECIKNKEYMLHGTQLMLKEQKKQIELECIFRLNSALFPEIQSTLFRYFRAGISA